MGTGKPSYKELESCLAEAEAIIAAMRAGGVGALVEDQAASLGRIEQVGRLLHAARVALDLRGPARAEGARAQFACRPAPTA